MNVEGHNLGVYKTEAGRCGSRIGNWFGQRTFAALNEAKLALFDDFWAMTQDDDGLWAAGRLREPGQFGTAAQGPK